MPRRNAKPDPRQMPLLYDRTPQGVLDLRSIDPAAAGLSRRRWLQVRELAAAVLYCGAHDGCRASVSKLIEVANRNKLCPVIGSPATFYRVRATAVAIGVIVDDPEYGEHGRTFSERAVDLARVAALVELSRNLAKGRRETAARLKMRKVRVTCESPESHRLLTTNPFKPSKQTVDNSPQTSSTGIDIVRAGRVAREIVAACGKATPRDWLFAVKVAILAAELGEHWLRDALRGVALCSPRRPYAYLTACLKEKAESYGRRLERELARVSVPEELSQLPTPITRERRLCAVEPL